MVIMVQCWYRLPREVVDVLLLETRSDLMCLTTHTNLWFYELEYIDVQNIFIWCKYFFDWTILIVMLSVCYAFVSLSKYFSYFFFQAKAKEKKEKKTGERDDTVPPEYRLTPELVSF